MDLSLNQKPNYSGSIARRYWINSLLVHVGLILFILFSHLLFPSKSILMVPSVHVDIVALPGQVKDTSHEIDTALPIKEMAKAAPVEEKQPVKEEMTLSNKKEKKKNPAQEAKEALAKLRKEVEESKRKEKKDALKKFEDRYREALKGNQVHSGTSTDGALNNDTLNAYAAHVTDRLRSNWSLPTFLQKNGYRAVVHLYVDSSGTIFRFAITQSSGNDVFDSYVKSCIQRSSPFAPPPAEMATGLRNSGMEVLFPL